MSAMLQNTALFNASFSGVPSTDRDLHGLNVSDCPRLIAAPPSESCVRPSGSSVTVGSPQITAPPLEVVDRQSRMPMTVGSERIEQAPASVPVGLERIEQPRA
eukprot:s57_g57.t1